MFISEVLPQSVRRYGLPLERNHPTGEIRGAPIYTISLVSRMITTGDAPERLRRGCDDEEASSGVLGALIPDSRLPEPTLGAPFRSELPDCIALRAFAPRAPAIRTEGVLVVQLLAALRAPVDERDIAALRFARAYQSRTVACPAPLVALGIGYRAHAPARGALAGPQAPGALACAIASRAPAQEVPACTSTGRARAAVAVR